MLYFLQVPPKLLCKTSLELVHELSVVRLALTGSKIILSRCGWVLSCAVLSARVVVMVRFLLQGSTHTALTYQQVLYTLWSHSLWWPKPHEKIQAVNGEQKFIAPQGHIQQNNFLKRKTTCKSMRPSIHNLKKKISIKHPQTGFCAILSVTYVHAPVWSRLCDYTWKPWWGWHFQWHWRKSH